MLGIVTIGALIGRAACLIAIKGESFWKWWFVGALLFHRGAACRHSDEVEREGARTAAARGRDEEMPGRRGAGEGRRAEGAAVESGQNRVGVVLVFGALFVLMMVIGLLTAPGARDTTSPTAARESAVEPPTLGREPEAEKVQASLLVAAYERNEIAADQQFKGTHRRSLARLAVSVCGRDRH